MSPATPLFPIMLSLAGQPVMVVGEGDEARNRARDLAAHGADVAAFLDGQQPTPTDFDRLKPRLVFVALPRDADVSVIADVARRAGALVHVQDRIPDCDFHLPARLRRGRLLLTVSTDGAVAGLSRLIRDHIGRHVIGEEWAARVEELSTHRASWKAEGFRAGALFERIVALVDARGWLAR